MSKFLKMLLGLAVLIGFNTGLKATKFMLTCDDLKKIASDLVKDRGAMIKKYTDQAFYAGIDPKTGQIIPNEQDRSRSNVISQSLYKTMRGYRKAIEQQVGAIGQPNQLSTVDTLLNNMRNGLINRFSSSRSGFKNAYVLRYMNIANELNKLIEMTEGPFHEQYQIISMDEFNKRYLNFLCAKVVLQDLLFALWDCAAIQGRQERFLKDPTDPLKKRFRADADGQKIVDFRQAPRQHFFGISIPELIEPTPSLDAKGREVKILNDKGEFVSKPLMDCGWISTIFFRFKVIGYTFPLDPPGFYLLMVQNQVDQFIEAIQWFISLAVGDRPSSPRFQVPTETFSSRSSSTTFGSPTFPPSSNFGGAQGPRVNFSDSLPRPQSSTRPSALSPSSPVNLHNHLFYSFLAEGGSVNGHGSQSLFENVSSQRTSQVSLRPRQTSTSERRPSSPSSPTRLMQRPPSPISLNPFLLQRPPSSTLLSDFFEPGPFPSAAIRPASPLRMRPKAPSSDSLPMPTFSSPQSLPSPTSQQKEKKKKEDTILGSPISFPGGSSSSSSSSTSLPIPILVPPIFSSSSSSSRSSISPTRPVSPRYKAQVPPSLTLESDSRQVGSGLLSAFEGATSFVPDNPVVPDLSLSQGISRFVKPSNTVGNPFLSDSVISNGSGRSASVTQAFPQLSPRPSSTSPGPKKAEQPSGWSMRNPFSRLTSYLPSARNLSILNPFGSRSTSTPPDSRLSGPTSEEFAATEQGALAAAKEYAATGITNRLNQPILTPTPSLRRRVPAAVPSRGSSQSSKSRPLSQGGHIKQVGSTPSYGAALLSKPLRQMSGAEFNQVREARLRVRNAKKGKSDVGREKNLAALRAAAANLQQARNKATTPPPHLTSAASALSNYNPPSFTPGLLPNFGPFPSSSSSTNLSPH